MLSPFWTVWTPLAARLSPLKVKRQSARTRLAKRRTVRLLFIVSLRIVPPP